MVSIATPWMWSIFFCLIFFCIFIDIFLMGRYTSHRISGREALIWTGTWFTLALLFNGFLWIYLNETQTLAVANQKSLEFFTGYLIEKSLSVDNIFVIYMIFHYFSIPVMHQKRVLIYGVLGAIFLRLLFITLGISLINEFHWVLYVFGIFLVITGVKMIFSREKALSLPDTLLFKLLQRFCRISHVLSDGKFFIRQHGARYLTPLFLALIFIEVSDIVFAIDSIPTIIAITRDPFIIFTSNVFAILGLRALYYFLAHLNEKFKYLKYGLACILMFVGAKMLLEPWFAIPVLMSLGVVVLMLLLSIVLSIRFSR